MAGQETNSFDVFFFGDVMDNVQQIGEVSSGGYLLIFWMFQNPPDLLFSIMKAMTIPGIITDT